MHKPPVITIDGSSGVGKGTIAKLLATELGWHYLDSGALYRALAWAVNHSNVNFEDDEQLQDFILSLDLAFEAHGDYYALICQDQDISAEIRTEACGQLASTLAAKPLVRQELFQKQLSFRQLPGLVTDGRDMGTVIFPDATLKFFFEANPQERADRRHKQLKSQGKHVNLCDVLAELVARDHRDSTREVAPLKPAEDAIAIDTSSQTVEATFAEVLQAVQQKLTGQ